MTKRITYESKKAFYNLNPENIFDVVSALDMYKHAAIAQAAQDNKHTYFTPSVILCGEGRRLVVNAEVANERGDLSRFDLVDLVLAEDKLTLRVNAHPRVAIPSEDLGFLAKRYLLK